MAILEVKNSVRVHEESNSRRILEVNFPQYGCNTAYEYGYQHGLEDREKKVKYRPEIFLNWKEQKEYEQGYRTGRGQSFLE